VRVERGLEGKGDFDDLKGGGAAQLRKKTHRAINQSSEETSGGKKKKTHGYAPATTQITARFHTDSPRMKKQR
jgi:hypothetical protein